MSHPNASTFPSSKPSVCLPDGFEACLAAMMSAASMDQLVQSVADYARRLLGARQCFVRMAGVTACSISQTVTGDHTTNGKMQACACPVATWIPIPDHPMRLSTAETELNPPWPDFAQGGGGHPPLHGWLAAPVPCPDGISVVALSDRYQGEFGSDDEALLVHLAAMAAMAADRLRLAAEARATRKELERETEARMRGDRRLAIQDAMVRTLSESSSLAEAVPKILETICRNLNWDLGMYWHLDTSSNCLKCLDYWHEPGYLGLEAFVEFSRHTNFIPGRGLPGRVWVQREPVSIPDVVVDPNFPRASYAAQCGLHGAFAFPLHWTGEVIGVVEFFSRQIRSPEGEFLPAFGILGSQIGQFVERRRTEATVRESESRWRQLAETCPDIIISLDRSGEILFANHSVPGYPPVDQLVGTNVFKWVSKDQHERFRQNLERVFTKAEVVEYDNSSVRPDGQIDWWTTRMGPVIHDNQVLSATVISTDITARKVAESGLLRSKTFLESANAQLRQEIAARQNAETQLADVVARLALPPQCFDLGDRVFPIDNLSMTNLMECGTAIRAMSGHHSNMESLAGELTQFFHDRIVDDTGKQALALVRMFETRAYAELDDELKAIALGSDPSIRPETRCLVLVATAGDEPAWNQRRSSVSHRVIPMSNEAALGRLPMVSRLINELGMEVADVLRPAGELPVGASVSAPVQKNGSPWHPPTKSRLFHVAEAMGSRFIPAQEEFVQRFGIRSVFGFGDMLPNGRMFALIAFSKVPVDRETASLFSHLLLSTRLAVLPFCDSNRRIEAQIVSLDRLLANHERIVAEQEKKLRETVGDLIHAKERFRLVIQSAPNAIVMVDHEGKISLVNTETEKMFGYSREELVGQPVEILVPDRYRAAHAVQVREFLEAPRKRPMGMAIDLFGKKRNGDEIPLEIGLNPMNTTKGDFVLASIIDISERKKWESDLRRAKEAAEVANQVKSEFLANMSHEIRTPMNGIIGMTELALDTELSHEQREYLGMVKSSADSLLTVINDILDFSKVEAGKLELESLAFGLHECLDDTIATLALRAHRKGLELACHVPPDVPPNLEGDPGRLRQILVNLVGNSIKFTERGEILVNVAMDSVINGQVRLHFAVSDTGIGIPADKQGQLFKAFSQVDTSTTRKHGGTGLGLAIAAHLVHLMKGEIWVESELGKGSTFHFTAVFGKAKDSGIRAALIKPQSLNGLPVLIVDDNATNRRILMEMLTQWGMKPASAENGKAALEALERARAAGTPFSLVLLDKVMPEMDGFMLAAKIKQNPDLVGAALMMISSADRHGDEERCRALGLAAYLSKPIRQSELLNTILSVLSSSRPSLVEGSTRTGILPTQHPLRILLAEDNDVNQRLAVRLLEKRGHTVVLAKNGLEALSALAAHPFDAVLMDVEMPEMDGYAATAEIRSHEKVTGRHIPVIAMTAHAMKGARERCLAAGMDGYVSKPFQPRTLFEAVESLAATGGQQAPAALPVLDRAELLEHVGGDEELMREMVELFRADCPRMVENVRSAIDPPDAARLRLSAHALKGALGTLGARAAKELAWEMEQMGKSADLARAPTVMPLLIDELARLEKEMTRIMAPDAGPSHESRSAGPGAAPGREPMPHGT